MIIRKKFSRTQLLAYTANLPWSLIGMEACSGAHFFAAKLRAQGHEVKLIPAQFVKPFLKSNKNDFIDAEAIAEAVTRQNMRFVPIKTDDQLDLQALHRVRDRLVHRRTALINQIRGFLLERGITFAKGPAKLRNQMPRSSKMPIRTSPHACAFCSPALGGVEATGERHRQISEEIEHISHDNKACRRLRQIPGVGPLVATATMAAIGNGAAFRKGREFAAWLGLVPRQHSTGGKPAYSASASAATLPAPHVHPRGARRGVSRKARHGRPWSVGASALGARHTQQSHRGGGEQAGPNRLGGTVPTKTPTATAAAAVEASAERLAL